MNDLNYSVSFFQQVRTGTRQSFEWYLSASRIVTRDLAGHPLLVLTVAQRLDPASHINHKVQRLLDENAFLRTHCGCFATPASARCCAAWNWASRPRKLPSVCLSRPKRPRPTAATTAASCKPSRYLSWASMPAPLTLFES